jgi:sulfur carrier protein
MVAPQPRPVRMSSSSPIRIQLNGEPRQLPASTTVAALVEHLGHAGRRVAVEVNREIVPKSRHAERELVDGDVVELVHALGGG